MVSVVAAALIWAWVWGELHYNTVQCCALKCWAEYGNEIHSVCPTVQCSAVNCSTVPCIALHCIALHCIEVKWSAVQCNAVQCSAVLCSLSMSLGWKDSALCMQWKISLFWLKRKSLMLVCEFFWGLPVIESSQKWLKRYFVAKITTFR